MNLNLRRMETPSRHQTCGRRIMKVVGLQLVLPLAVAAVAFTATDHAQASGRHGISRRAIHEKITYCEDCHGTRGQGFRGYYPIPRLAGQQPQYLRNQLRAFVDGDRPNPIMSRVAHVLRPAMVAAVIQHFRHLNPPPYGGAPRRLIARGRNIFQNGIPQRNVAACAACHGPRATGHGEIPRLAGQLYWYEVRELNNWPKERGQRPSLPDTSIIMKPVAHSLTRPEIRAVAAYVSSLR